MKLHRIISYALAPRRGIKPMINEAHIVKTLILLYTHGPFGRQTLSKILGAGESSIRTLIRRLKELDLVDVSKAGGAYLTKTGEAVVETLLKKIVPPKTIDISDLEYLKLSRKACAMILKGFCKKYPNVLRIRDSLIRHGAEAALIICVKGGKLVLLSPQGNGIDETTIKELNILKTKLNIELRNEDLILISYADTSDKCETSLYKFIVSEGIV